MLEDKLQNLPSLPGVYLMKNKQDKIIYVGKAVNLKNRIKSYFSSQHRDSAKTRALVQNIYDLEYIITDTEIEALILENNLIKEHKPKYNVRLTDDKNYPFIRVTLQESYPRLEIVRSLKKDGARYFGPFTSASAVHETLRLLKRIFPIRSCKQRALPKRDRPCLNAHIKRCAAPCVGKISQEEYNKMIQEVILFLEGKQENLLKALQEKMEKAAEELNFERAAEIRDQLAAVEKVVAKQKIISDRYADMDVINYVKSIKKSCVQVFMIREGKLLGRDHFFLETTEETEGPEVLGAFLKQYYNQVEYIPREILMPEEVEEQEVLTAWLKGKRGGRVELKVPKQGDKRHLLEMVGKNALDSLQQEIVASMSRNNPQDGLAELAASLKLEDKPQRMECYDISHIQGAETVASMVVFVEGKPCSSEYRRFKIKTVEGPDDFASMEEVIRRRFNKATAGDEKFATLPQLIVIDGGKGQLSSARKVMEELGYGDIPTVGLAKENEWIFTEDSSEPIILSRRSQGLYLIQRIRDEAHRFAITYHRLLRGKRNLSSVLTDIPGIGKKRKEALLKHFNFSIKKIMQATPQELSEVEGINEQIAEQIYEFFHPAE